MRLTKRSIPAALDNLQLEGLGAPIEVRRHSGARQLTLRVSRTRRTVILTLPSACELGEAGTFLHRHIDWVRERLGSLPEPVPFHDGAVIPLRGAPHRLTFAGTRLAGGAVERVDKGTAKGSLPELRIGGRPEHAPRRLREWLYDEVRRDLDTCVLWHARALRVRPRRITIRDQASRWGSCSTTGVLSFSWRLVLAPPLILDYLAAHEVAHLAEMNHSTGFWSLVRRTMPRMDEARGWLRHHGMDLHRYGPPTPRA